MITPRKIRVLVVDDSAMVRRAISDALAQDSDLEVVGTACDSYVARDKILELNPDVLTLDIEMPRMDGLTFLRVLQQHRPMPVVVVSSLTQTGSQKAVEALAAGAVEVVGKPNSAWTIGELRTQLPRLVKGAARARVKAARAGAPAGPVRSASTNHYDPRQLLVLGASTGGTEALTSVLSQLPDGLPGICVVQHMPPVFSRAFANRLNECCTFEVREAADGDEARPGLALVAPGDYHMSVGWEGGRYRVRLAQGPPLHHTRPAVDVLFNSAASCAGYHAVAVLLTGMGSDGAQGMRKLKDTGATTLAQDEETSVVYGMPRAAVEMGVVDHVLPLDQMPQAILDALESRMPKARHPLPAGCDHK